MRRDLVAIVAVAGLWLAGCGGQDQQTASAVNSSRPAATRAATPTQSAPSPTPDITVSPAPGVSSPAPPATPDLDQYTPLPSGLVDEHTGETVSPEPQATWDAQSRREVITAAVTAMRAYARPRADYDTWWAGFEPLLTQSAAEDYAWVDPATIPVTRVSGPGRIVDDTSAYLARVQVPTNVGRYTVILNRRDDNAPWLVVRLVPPPGVH